MIFDRDDHAQMVELQARFQQRIIAKAVRMNLDAIADIIVIYFLHSGQISPSFAKKYYFLTLYQTWYMFSQLFYLTVIRNRTSLPIVRWVQLINRESVEETYFVSHN